MNSLRYQRLDSLGAKYRPVLKAGPFGSSVKKESYVESGFKVYGQQEVLSGNLGAKNYYINQETFKRHKNCSVQAGDILITMMGTVGKVLVIPNAHEPGIINPRLMRISLDSTKVNPEFVKNFLETPKLQSLLERRSHGGTMPGLNAEVLASIKVPVPDLEYQNYAVKVFEQWDRAIEKTEALIDAKERQFGWLRLKLFDDVSQKEHLTPLGELVKFTDGYPFLSSEYSEDGIYNILTIANVQYGSMAHSFKGKLSQIPKRVKKAQILDLGDILISMTGNVGRVCKVDTPNCLLNQRVGKLQTNKNINPDFIYFSLLNQKFLKKMIAQAQGGAQGNLSKKDILKYQVILPPLEQQKRIAETLKTARQEINLLKKLSCKYRDQKRGLMQKLLTGKLKVKK